MVSNPEREFTVVIVNYNLSTEILNCLDSLESWLPDGSFRVVVVDNNSTDSRFPRLIELMDSRPHYTLVQLEQNTGFGSACNEGALLADTRFICFLNPDTTIEDNFLNTLKQSLLTGDSTMVGPVYQEKSVFEFSSGYFPNALFEFLSIFMVGRHLEAFIMAIRRRLSGPLLNVDWILGACMLIPKKEFERVGGFDTDYFLFFEEMDLCKRICAHGGVISVATNCRINHIGSVSGKKDYALFTERFYQGKLRYLNKQVHGIRRILLLRLVWLQLHSQRLLWSVLSFFWPDRSGQKIQGLIQALSFYRTIT